MNIYQQKVLGNGGIEALIDEMEGLYRIKFFRTRLIARVQYQYTLTSGLSILEQSVDSKAKTEFMEFYKEVRDVEAGK